MQLTLWAASSDTALSRWDRAFTDLMMDPLGRLLLAFSFFTLILVAVLLILIPLLRRSVNLTLRRLVRGVEEIRQTGPGRPLPTDVSAEAQELVGELNHLLGELRDRIGSLERQRDEVRAIVDSPRDHGVVAVDPEGHISFLSSGASRLLGYGADEILGRHVEALFPEEDWNRVVPKLTRKTLRESGILQRVNLLRKDRSVLAASLSVAESTPPGGGSGFVGIFRDVSEQVSLERRLLESEQRHRS